MENEKPKSIKTTGLIIIIISALIIFSNRMGALMSILIGINEAVDPNAGQIQTNPISYIFSHYIEMCLFIVTIGLIYLLSGIFIQKYKLWANRFATVISGLQIIFVWCIMLILRSSIGYEPGMEIFKNGAIATAIIWTIPFGLLIWFLNKKGIKEYFN
jgi:hypothetical protein